MEIIDRKPIPLYESVCPECKSRFRYTKVEISWQHIACPVCGMGCWASDVPVAYKETEETNDYLCDKCSIPETGTCRFGEENNIDA